MKAIVSIPLIIFSVIIICCSNPTKPLSAEGALTVLSNIFTLPLPVETDSNIVDLDYIYTVNSCKYKNNISTTLRNICEYLIINNVKPMKSNDTYIWYAPHIGHTYRLSVTHADTIFYSLLAVPDSTEAEQINGWITRRGTEGRLNNYSKYVEWGISNIGVYASGIYGNYFTYVDSTNGLTCFRITSVNFAYNIFLAKWDNRGHGWCEPAQQDGKW